MNDANHIGDLNEMVVGDNDHGDAIPEPKCGVCLCNRALEEDFKDSLDAHDEMRLEIVRLTKERDEARREVLEAMHPDLRNGYANAREWDCIKEDGKPCQ